jgi:hypothetical protein
VETCTRWAARILSCEMREGYDRERLSDSAIRSERTV